MSKLLSSTWLALALTAGPASAATLAEPPAPAGTVAYNEWLGRTFSEVMLNERSQAGAGSDPRSDRRQGLHPAQSAGAGRAARAWSTSSR